MTVELIVAITIVLMLAGFALFFLGTRLVFSEKGGERYPKLNKSFLGIILLVLGAACLGATFATCIYFSGV